MCPHNKPTLSEQNRDESMEGMGMAAWGNGCVDEVKVDMKRESQALRRRKKVSELSFKTKLTLFIYEEFPKGFFFK